MEVAPVVQMMELDAIPVGKIVDLDAIPVGTVQDVGALSGVLANYNVVHMQHVSSGCVEDRYQVSTETGRPIMAVVFGSAGCSAFCGSKPATPSCSWTEAESIEFLANEGKSGTRVLTLRFVSECCGTPYVEFIENQEPLLRGEPSQQGCANLFGTSVWRLIDPGTRQVLYTGHRGCCLGNEITFFDTRGRPVAEARNSPPFCDEASITIVTFRQNLPAEHRSSVLGCVPIIFEWK